jgi:hypothetical protein
MLWRSLRLARSDRKTKHSVACWYQLYIELISSESSALEVLYIQHVSIHTHSNPCFRAIWHLSKILVQPRLETSPEWYKGIASNDTSSSVHR